MIAAGKLVEDGVCVTSSTALQKTGTGGPWPHGGATGSWHARENLELGNSQVASLPRARDILATMLSTSPQSVQRVAEFFLEQTTAGGEITPELSVPALECIAAAARLAGAGMCAAVSPTVPATDLLVEGSCPPHIAQVSQEEVASRLLEAADAALRCCEAAEGAEELADAGGRAALMDVAARTKLGLASARLSLGQHQTALEALTAARKFIFPGSEGSGTQTVTGQLSGAWLEACAAQGFTLRRTGHTESALAALELALTGCAALAEAGPLEQWLLRQLAACDLALGKPGQSLTRAREASARAVPGAGAGHCPESQLAALRLTLRAVCRGVAPGMPEVGVTVRAANAMSASREAADAAFAFIAHPLSSAADIASACCELADHGLEEEAGAALSRHLRAQSDSSLPSVERQVLSGICRRCILWTSARRAEVAAMQTAHGSAGGDDSHCHNMLVGLFPPPLASIASGGEEDENAGNGSSGDVDAALIASQILSLARSALDAGRSDVAAAWLQHPQVKGGDGVVGDNVKQPSAAVFAAFIDWCRGRPAQAAAAAESALQRSPRDSAALVVLLLAGPQAAPAGDASGAWDAQLAARRRSAADALSPALFAAVALHAADGSTQTRRFCLEALAVAASGGWSSTEGVGAERATAAFLQLASAVLGAINQSDRGASYDEGLILRGLDGAATLGVPIAGTSGTNVAAPSTGVAAFGAGGRPALLPRQVFEFLWNQGIHLGSIRRWRLTAAAFDRAHAVLAASPQEADSSGGVLRAAEEGQMCLVARAAALLEELREVQRDPNAFPGPSRTELCFGVVQAAARARAACGVVAQLRPPSNAPGGASADKALPLLALIEFEARCAAGDGALGVFLDGLGVGFHPRIYLMMARLALRAGSRDVAMRCLKILLAASTRLIAGGAVDLMERYALGARELICLHTSRDDGLVCFEEIGALLHSTPCAAQAYPVQELRWLVAVAWGNAAYHGRSNDLLWAQRWAQAALRLAAFCPSMVEERQHIENACRWCSEGLPAYAVAGCAANVGRGTREAPTTRSVDAQA